MLGDEAIQRRIGNEAVFDHFRQAGTQFAQGQTAQQPYVRIDRPGLIERACQVLSHGQIHRHLAAHTGIDLRQKGCGYLNERYAA